MFFWLKNRIKTWHFELLFVAIVLFTVTRLTKNSPIEYLGSLAVLFSFAYAQISDRLTEREAVREKPSVDCYWKGIYFFIGKEICWFAYFLMMKSYSALVGVFIFLLYPMWRKLWRRIKPL